MATQAQMDEKAPVRAAAPSNTSAATPAQLAEKSGYRRDPLEGLATSAQLDEKRRNEFAHSQRSDLAGAATSGQLEDKARNAGSYPPLPPRTVSVQAAPPPYTSDDAKRSELISEQWKSHDPRSSSTHSLVPDESDRDGRRTLLLIFIHGFMGNELSFQSFPAHIHNLLSITLAETHVVHTKIYPRYQSKKAINFARDDFSTWLEPHEGPKTEVILLGHSMGGLLSAEVVLQRPFPPIDSKSLRHRILGTINFDTPFLGMHPGIVGAGLSSLFRSAPEPGAAKPTTSLNSGANTPMMSSQASISSQSYAPSLTDSDSASQLSLVQSITSPTSGAPPKDPFFNAPFPNDIRLPERKGLANIFHFIHKHSDGITSATKNLFMSHIEFGSCMADYTGLKNRYQGVRTLEDVDDMSRKQGQSIPKQNTRVRFVNYYTASTGRPKAVKPPPTPPSEEAEDDENLQSSIEENDTQSANVKAKSLKSASSDMHLSTSTSRVSIEEDVDERPIEEQIHELGENSGVQDDGEDSGPIEMRHIDSMPMEDDDDLYSAEPVTKAKSTVVEETVAEEAAFEETGEEIVPVQSEPPLPPLPEVPTKPETIDLTAYTDKDSRKIAEKEFKRVTKVYQQAVKDRESAIKDRKKLVEKREKKARQEEEKKVKAEEKQRLKEEKESQKELTGEEKRLAEEAKRMAREADRLAGRPSEPDESEVPASDVSSLSSNGKGKAKEEAAPKAPSTKSKGKQKERKPSATPSVEDNKPKKDRKFCMLPPTIAGEMDKCWIRIYMEGVDEVGAHCGLFFPGPQYESLVGDVGNRIGEWVAVDADRRAIVEAERT